MGNRNWKVASPWGELPPRPRPERSVWFWNVCNWMHSIITPGPGLGLLWSVHLGIHAVLWLSIHWHIRGYSECWQRMAIIASVWHNNVVLCMKWKKLYKKKKRLIWNQHEFSLYTYNTKFHKSGIWSAADDSKTSVLTRHETVTVAASFRKERHPQSMNNLLLFYPLYLFILLLWKRPTYSKRKKGNEGGSCGRTTATNTLL